MADFITAHHFTAKWEGALSDVPQDRGGITKYGVSLLFLQGIAKTQKGRDNLHRMGIVLPVTPNTIRQLSAKQAENLFRMEFWNPLHLDTLPQRPALFLYDCAVNHGPQRAVILAQRGVNAASHASHLPLLPMAKDGLEAASGKPGALAQWVTPGLLVEDGKLGPLTRSELSRDLNATLRACVDARRHFFGEIIKKDGTQAVFLNGWLNRCHDLARALEVA